ncbi:histone deacetylase [Marinomonas piezotolerans]|uniref:Histone deacetylase n=2 Tax=Marinomonas piezotolerans TaxID=2213058 RepID=A0A370U871_9GAMM|nr:histone deacetylase [Marinomonas piezotolerans]
MPKFRLLAEHLEALGILTEQNCYSPSPLSLSALMRAHDQEYVQRFIRGKLSTQEQKDIGLPWSEWLVERTLRAVSGTMLTADLAIKHRLACHLAGGTHHAFPDRGAGFCIFNDLAVAALDLIYTKRANKIMIIDCDVHQGDGTTAFFSNQSQVVPVSFHCDDNYPLVKQSTGINISIPKGAEDREYLEIIESNIPELLKVHCPDFVFYDGGVDVHKDDRLGHVQLSDSGIFNRDRYIINQVVEYGAPIACVIGGGYDHDHNVIAARHGLLHQAAADVWRKMTISNYV